ncbi:MAG: glycosyltransferase family 2 protein [Actinomycetota bacterium]
MTNQRERVDVGVVTWNTKDLTIAALRRLLDTDQGCDLRLLVRDNASSDGSAEAIAREVPEAELEVGPENVGFAAGMNRLIARSVSPWFFALNPDAWPEKLAIGRLIASAKAHPEAAAIAPRLQRPDGELEHSTLPFPSLRVAAAGLVGRRWISAERGERMMLVGRWAHDRARDVDWAVGAALLIPRAALEDVGPFSERFFMYVEDLEWCWRARQRGWTIRFEPSAVVVHVGNAAGAQRYGDRRTRAYMTNTYRFYRTEHGLAASAAYRALNVLGSARGYLRAKRSGSDGEVAYWRRELGAHLPARRR